MSGNVNKSEAMRKRNLERYADPENRRKHSEMMKRRYKNPEARKKTSEAAKKRYAKISERIKTAEATKLTWRNPAMRMEKVAKISKRMKRKWDETNYRTKAEMVFHKLHPEYAQQVIFKTRPYGGLHEWGCWWFRVDFYDEDSGEIIEIDGSWHDKPAYQERDKRKDAFFAFIGMGVTRIKNAEVLCYG
ncbi:hypothetical protein LCGC14_2092130 [marine sediment metagenome]|uniref:DUF559 domain-containing protein n=1 Tax=marine sediment metagenome TaxID=412755 RepID=A0A0F9H9A3_9ZZZZ